MSAQCSTASALVQVEAAKVARVREAAITKLKSLEKQKAEVEKTRDDIKYDFPLPTTAIPSFPCPPSFCPSCPPSYQSSLAHFYNSSSDAN